MRFTQVIVSNLLRRKLRSLLTICGVAIAVGAVVALIGVASGFESSWSSAYADRGVDLIVQRTGTASRVSGGLDARLAANIATVANVAQAVPGLNERLPLRAGGALGSPVCGFPVHSFVMEHFRITGGRKLADGDAQSVLLGESLARALEKTVGDALEIEGTTFQVVGTFQNASTLENNMCVMPLESLQLLMDRPHEATFLQIQLQPQAHENATVLAQVRRDIEALRGANGQPLGLASVPARDFASRTLEVRAIRGMSMATSALAVFLGVLGLANTMVMSVLERTQEIGILRAIGWRRSRIVRMILGESLGLCLLGAACGVAVGMVLARGLCAAPAVDGLFQPRFSAGPLGAAAAVAVVTGLTGGLYAAWRGARILPTEALRYE